jgi:CRISPR system Cascade subunit CasD
MPRYTVFTLAGPFASFGGVAGNERRGSMDRPGHSMLVGLVSAALGIRRSDEDRLARLSAACRFAVRADAPGQPLIDYHTVQTAALRRGFAPTTRKQLLDGGRAAGRLDTTLTRREYRTDVRFTVAVELAGEALTHEAIDAALRWPRLVLYLGRKSCPPSLPLDPKSMTAETVPQAFAAYDEATGHRACELAGFRRGDGTISGEAEIFPPNAGNLPHRREARRVKPLSRRTWQFALLDDLVLLDPPVDGTRS